MTELLLQPPHRMISDEKVKKKKDCKTASVVEKDESFAATSVKRLSNKLRSPFLAPGI